MNRLRPAAIILLFCSTLLVAARGCVREDADALRRAFALDTKQPPEVKPLAQLLAPLLRTEIALSDGRDSFAAFAGSQTQALLAQPAALGLRPFDAGSDDPQVHARDYAAALARRIRAQKAREAQPPDEALARTPRQARLADLLILVDTSASSLDAFKRQIGAVRDVVAALRRGAALADARLTVACFDQTLQVIYRGVPARFGWMQTEAIWLRQPLGATNLGGALRWAATQPHTRWLLLTDGLATVGRVATPDLLAELKRAARLRRVDVLTLAPDKRLVPEGLLPQLVRGRLDAGRVFRLGKQTHSALALALTQPAPKPAAIRPRWQGWHPDPDCPDDPRKAPRDFSTDTAPPSQPPPQPTPSLTQSLTQSDGHAAAALAWMHHDQPTLTHLMNITQAAELHGRRGLARRALGAIIDRLPKANELAARRLLALGEAGRALGLDALTQAVLPNTGRPVNGEARVLAQRFFAASDAASAFEVLAQAGARREREVYGAALLARDPTQRARIQWALGRLDPPDTPSLQVIAHWVAGGCCDLDLYVQDGQRQTASFDRDKLASGGVLVADERWTQEAFAIDGGARAFPYTFRVNAARCGRARGWLQILQHDGKGGLKQRWTAFELSGTGDFASFTLQEPL